MSLHIYTKIMQPATAWVDNNSSKPIHGGFEPDVLIYTDCCNKKRPAKDCVVQTYYDGIMIWCDHDKGCKDPATIAAKKAKEFANRSAAQKKRWAKS